MRNLTQDGAMRHERLFYVALAFVWCFVLTIVFKDKSFVEVSSSFTETLALSAQSAIANKIAKPPPPEPVHVWPTEFDLIPWKTDGIKEKCDSQMWRPHLYFQCDMNYGGFGNVRNLIANCARLAIEAGATLVMPRLWERDLGDLSKLTAKYNTLDYLFDKDFFNQSLLQACPQLKLVPSLEDVPWLDEAVIPAPLIPKTLQADHKVPDSTIIGFGPMSIEQNTHYREWFDNWLSREVGTPTAQSPIVVRIGSHPQVYFSWRIHTDPPDFWQYFGRITRPRSDLAEIALEALHNLNARINASHALEPESAKPEHHKMLSTFYGAHMRAEADVADWSSKDDLINMIITGAQERNFKLIFVATGEIQNYLDLQAKANESSIEVINKYDLLSPASLTYIEGLHFDQLALIDYLILIKSGFFNGHRYSSFSHAIASYRLLLESDPKERVRHGDEGPNFKLVGQEEHQSFWQGTYP